MSQDENPPAKRAGIEEDFVARLIEAIIARQTPGFTPQEIADIRAMLKSRDRVQWVASGLKTWALWGSALIAFSTVGIQALKTIVKALVGT